jgi:RHS repeat-associated protein
VARACAEVDLSGALAGSWRYRAYGDIAQSSGQSTPTILGYAGQLLDPSGLYYMRARWYDPASGRFVTRDLLNGTTSAPRAFNAFAYAGANPIYSFIQPVW